MIKMLSGSTLTVEPESIFGVVFILNSDKNLEKHFKIFIAASAA